MEIRCPQCGHRFDAMGEVLIDCPCCHHMIDTRTISPESEAEPPHDRSFERRRGENEAFSVKDLRREDGPRARAPRNADNWQEPEPDDNEFWAARQHKDVQDAIKYSASPKLKQMSERDRKRRAGYSPGMFTFIAGLFFPGAGHFRMGRPARGAAFFLLVILAGIVTFFAVPLDEGFDVTARGYQNLPRTNIYALVGSLLSSKVKYTVLAVGVAHLISIIDLIVLLGMGRNPRPDQHDYEGPKP